MRSTRMLIGAAVLSTVVLIHTSCSDVTGPSEGPEAQPTLSSEQVQWHPTGRADNIWRGPLPEVCMDVYLPVRDARGNLYDNACYAAYEGVRVTWNAY